MRKSYLIAVVIILFTLCIPMGLFARAAASVEEEQAGKAEERPFAELEEKWGVRPLSIRITGEGHFLDFRYLITDADKAKPVLSRGKKAYLEDEASGKFLSVPVTKLGPLRGTARQPKEGRQYFILFGNASGIVKKGNRVTVVIEEFRAENLVVE